MVQEMIIGKTDRGSIIKPENSKFIKIYNGESGTNKEPDDENGCAPVGLSGR